MKKTIIDIKEISDSKEVYSQRPNPVIPAFIYSMLALLLAAAVYCCFGKIEIVATASGIVRPNDDVSTVASLVSGRVTGVFYSDGQIVREGDPLLTIDTAETQISLDSLNNTQAEAQTQLEMIEKFLGGIENGKNPFSSDSTSDEYPYYVQYKDYELSLKNSKDKYEYDAENTEANIEAISAQICETEQQLSGLKAYKNSVQKGLNQASAYPEYERMYLLYVAKNDALAADYQAQRDEIELTSNTETNQYQQAQYAALVTDYGYLVSSIEQDASAFPAETSGNCVLLWNDYSSTLEEYKRTYEDTVKTYNYCLNGGSAGGNQEALLAYDRAMLEGYQYYKESVIEDTDKFVDGVDSAYYRTLYTEYKIEYDALVNEALLADQQYIGLQADPTATEDNIAAALAEKEKTEAACSDFKSTTLATIENTILQIEASIAEKEIGIGNTSSEYNTEMAKSEMESAGAAISAYKNKMLLEYQQVLTDYKNKLLELQLSASMTPDRATLLAELETAYKNSIQQNYYQTITQIDNSIQTLQSDLVSKHSTLKLYQITRDLYESSVDKNGVPLSISLFTIEQISSLLSQQETLLLQQDDIDTQIKQAEAQISQGTITAEQDGIVSVFSTLVKGDTLSAGNAFAAIVPINESEFKVQLYIDNSEIANIDIGDTIKYNLIALPSSQYGMVEGTVTSISTDALQQNGEYSGYYLVEGSIASKDLVDKDGNSGSIAIGMQVEAKIVTQKKTIIRYFLEKIDLF